FRTSYALQAGMDAHSGKVDLDNLFVCNDVHSESNDIYPCGTSGRGHIGSETPKENWRLNKHINLRKIWPILFAQLCMCMGSGLMGSQGGETKRGWYAVQGIKGFSGKTGSGRAAGES
ncbi:MAG: hypothetical protein V1758_09570, partial [Pseudomonadota bacterium]